MVMRFFRQLGEFNPQLFREIKGRFNWRNLGLSVGLSFLGQILLYTSFLGRREGLKFIDLSSNYCLKKANYLQYSQEYNQIQNQLYPVTGELPNNSEILQARLAELDKLMNVLCPVDAINFSSWWRDYWTEVFMVLSVVCFFALIVIGTYMLISDLTTEQRRGTLNFIRLSPQTYQSIFLGKMLGVPSLLYLATLLVIPYHIWAGLSGGIPILEIFSFYAVVVASCIFFYSLSLLFGLIAAGLSGFQAWLGTGFVFFCLLIANYKPIYKDGSDWINFFSPSLILRYFIDHNNSTYSNYPFGHNNIQGLTWFSLPLGTSATLTFVFYILHFCLWTVVIWQGLKRGFHNPDTTPLSKQQSYGITTCFTLISLGFSVQRFQFGHQSHIFTSLFWNLLLFVLLISALSPQRQSLLDWMRYRRERVNGKSHLLSDLILGERSPILIAIVLNLGIVTALFGLTTLLIASFYNRLEIMTSLLLSASLILFCVSVAQLMLLMKTSKRNVWAAGMVIAITIVPLIIFSFLQLEPSQNPFPFLFSPLLFSAIEYATPNRIALAFISQVMMIIAVNVQFIYKLRRLGKSDYQALLSGHSV